MSSRYLLTADAILQEFGRPPIRGAGLLVEDGIVMEVGSIGGYSEDVERLDFPGSTVIPGLIDTHVHLEFSVAENDDVVIGTYGRELAEGTVAARAVVNAQTLLYSGVTTVRDCASSYALLGVRRMIADGIPGPRVYVCGPPVTTTAGHLDWVGPPTDTTDEVRVRVRQLIDRGVDYVKLVTSGGSMTAGTNMFAPQYSLEDLRTAVDEAHRLNRPVVAHALNITSLERCLEAGVDSVDHARWHGLDGELKQDSELVRRIHTSGLNIGMTASGWTRALVDGSDADREALRNAFVRHREVRDAGGFMTLHTDSGSTGTDFGSIGTSLRVMVEALAVSNSDALRAVTVDAARALNLESSIGTLSEGRFADFVVLEGDPAEDLRYLARPIGVAKGGILMASFGRAT